MFSTAALQPERITTSAQVVARRIACVSAAIGAMVVEVPAIPANSNRFNRRIACVSEAKLTGYQRTCKPQHNQLAEKGYRKLHPP